MDPNIITIDSDDSNDAFTLPLKNHNSALVITQRVISTNSANSRINSNTTNLEPFKYCCVNDLVPQNNNHLKLTKDLEINTQNIETKEHYNNILKSHVSQSIDIIDSNVENLKPKMSNIVSGIEMYPNNNDRLLKGKILQSDKENTKVLIPNRPQSYNNNEIFHLRSPNLPKRTSTAFVVSNNIGEEQVLKNTEIPQLQISERRNMHRPQNYDFPVPDHAIAWSRNTTNFIKQSMNSVMQSVHQNPPNAHQSSIPRHHLSNTQDIIQKNIYEATEIRNTVYHTHTPSFSCGNSSNYFQPGYYNNGIMMNSYVPNNNFWMKVRLEEMPDRGEVVAQYFYNNETQTPVSVQNHFQMNRLLSNTNSQFLDISALSNIALNSDVKISPTNKLLESSEEDKRIKNCMSPLQQTQNKYMNLDKNHLNNNNISTCNSTDGDVIFVGEFKKDPSTKDTNSCNQNIGLLETKISLKCFENDDAKHIKKRPRKNYNRTEPRRNPKRQAQVNKDLHKLIDDIIWEDAEKENKTKKTVLKPHKEKNEKKPIRISPRINLNCGAVYSPPSPLSIDHIRKWPAEGMHEKPEYNPITGKIEPFDYVTRNILETYNAKKRPKRKCISDSEDDPNNISETFESINVLSHDMLHHMISYVATIIEFEKTEKKSTNEESKVQFLNNLGLTENENTILEKKCDNMKEMLKNIINVEDNDKGADKHNLKELLKHTMLLYCITNEVDQVDLVKYIDSLKPEEIVSLSKEQIEKWQHLNLC